MLKTLSGFLMCSLSLTKKVGVFLIPSSQDNATWSFLPILSLF